MCFSLRFPILFVNSCFRPKIVSEGISEPNLRQLDSWKVAKSASRAAERAPRAPKEWSRGPQDQPRASQERPEAMLLIFLWFYNGLAGRPRGLQEHPKSGQEASRSANSVPRAAKRAPRSAKSASRSAKSDFVDCSLVLQRSGGPPTPGDQPTAERAGAVEVGRGEAQIPPP